MELERKNENSTEYSNLKGSLYLILLFMKDLIIGVPMNYSGNINSYPLVIIIEIC